MKYIFSIGNHHYLNVPQATGTGVIQFYCYSYKVPDQDYLWTPIARFKPRHKVKVYWS